MKSTEGLARPLEKLLEDKSYIVANRLFQELSIEGVNEIHRQIQETIKVKNHELRKLFFSKYLELINCSQLIGDLSRFAGRIDDTATDIIKKAEIYREKPVELTERKDTIGVVERLVRRGKYFEAMMLCVRQGKDQTVSPSQTQILQIFEGDIVERVLSRLESHFDEQQLHEILKTLAAFILFVSGKYIVEGANYQAEYSNNMALLLKSLPTNYQSCTLAIALTIALKVAFYKVATSVRNTSKRVDLVSFVGDLENIVQASEHHIARMHQQLASAWNIAEEVGQLQVQLRDEQLNCFRELHRSLAVTMITTAPNKKVVFNHALYEEILKDEQLLDRLERLQGLLGSPSSFRFIMFDLWNDFYHQMVDSLIGCLDLPAVLKSLMKTTSTEQLPPEIRRHSYDRMPSQIFEGVKKNNAKLIFEFDQLREMLLKGAEKHAKQMYDHLVNRLNGWLNRTLDAVRQMFMTVSPKQRFPIIVATKLLVVSISDRIVTLKEFDQGEEIRKIVDRLESQTTTMTEVQMNLLFQQDKTTDKTVEYKMKVLEDKIMEYVPLAKQQTEQTLLKSLVLKMLEQLEKTLQGREVEKLRYTRRCLEGKPEEFSTYTILFNFIPKHLFKLSQTQDRVNVKVLEDLLREEKCVKRNFTKRQLKPAAPADRKELFDIGEAGNDVLRFASKFSNSIVGIIKGMST